MKQANILDPIHATLDPRVWDKADSPKPVLKAHHAHWIKSQIYDILKVAGYTDIQDWLTLCMTGSLCTYQYSDESDVDCSLFVDTKVFPEWSRAEMIGLMIERMDGRKLPGTPFPMQDFVVPGEVKPHDIYKPGLRSAYSIDTGKWIVPPERDRAHDVQVEENGFYAWALQMADKMERMLKFEPDKAVLFWHAIHKRRQQDMRAGKGDYAESNVIYKFLSNRGLFPKIAEVSGEHIAMAIDQSSIDNWIKEHGPYLYHGAKPRGDEDPEVIAQKIEQEGIVPKPYEEPPWQEIAPWTPEEEAQGIRSDENYDEHEGTLEEAWHTPRPNHVYLAPSAQEAYGPPIFRVDLRKLDPQNLNPDEDYMRDNTGAPTHWQQHLPPRTLGEQAETYNWSEPTDTLWSLYDRGVAHRGTIPPEAIQRIDDRGEYDEWDKHGRIAKTGAADVGQPGEKLWHVSPVENEQSILQRGLEPSSEINEGSEQALDHTEGPNPAGVYLWDELDTAKTYGGAGQHVWEVDVSGLPLVKDRFSGSGWIHPDTIPPNRIKRIAKTGAAQAMYHVAPAEHRKAIEEGGLTPGESDHYPQGVYLFAHPENAHHYANMLRRQWEDEYGASGNNDMDVWEVHHDGLHLVPDPEAEDPDESMEEYPHPIESYYATQPVPPERIKRIAKTAMAETSGFPELDRAVDEYIQAHPELQDLRDPANAWGRCQEISEGLANHLKERGYKAYCTSDELGAFGYKGNQKTEDIGAGDFTYPEHAAVEVYGLYGPNDVRNVTIDLTAAQYGHTGEWPKVHGGPSEAQGLT